MAKSKESPVISVIGAGSWGTALSTLLAHKAFAVTLWARDEDLAKKMQAGRRNPRYLTNLEIPKGLAVTSDLEAAVRPADVVVLAVPSHAMRAIVSQLKPFLSASQILITLSKGIEADSLKRMSEVLIDEIGEAASDRIAVLSGPNHAEEVAERIPTASVIASSSRDIRTYLQDIFMTPYFRVYSNSDVVGVELGGATKNVIAIAAGISDGLGFGDNTKASLMTRGLAEMSRLGSALGADSHTFAGLSGVGDLIVTCTSRHSRNRAVGEKLGRGMSLEQILKETTMVAEGVRTVPAVCKLAAQTGVEMPISHIVNQILYEGKSPRDCVIELMTRGPTSEV